MGGAVACTLAMYVAVVIGSPLSTVALCILPLPLIVVGSRHGVEGVALLAALGVVTIGLVRGADAGLLSGALIGLPAVVAVWGLRSELRIEQVVGYVVGVALLGSAVLLLASFGSLRGLHASVTASWQQSFDGMIDWYEQMGVPAERVRDLQMRRDEFEQILQPLMPAFAVVTMGALWLLNLRISRHWTAWPQVRDWKNWRAPEWLIWVLIGAGFSMFAPVAGLAVASRNVFVVVLGCYFCQGLAIVNFLLRRLRVPRGLRVATYLLVAVQHLLTGAVLAAGIFDLWGDFRRITQAGVENEEG